MPLLIGGVLLGGIGIMISQALGPNGTGTATVEVKVPRLSAMAGLGAQAFKANCAACHGANAGGSDKGPPLIHDIYNPGHHGDAAFYRAAKLGVRAHHWQFGNMPPRPGVSNQQLALIVRYIRELQQANGIVSRPHRM